MVAAGGCVVTRLTGEQIELPGKEPHLAKGIVEPAWGGKPRVVGGAFVGG